MQIYIPYILCWSFCLICVHNIHISSGSKGIRIWKERLEKWKPQWCEKILRCATLWMKDFKKGYDSHNVFSWSRWNFAPFPSYNSYSFSLNCFPSRPYLWRMDPNSKMETELITGSSGCWKSVKPHPFIAYLPCLLYNVSHHMNISDSSMIKKRCCNWIIFLFDCLCE